MSVPGALERTVDEHRSIADALQAGDAELAAAAATLHIAGVEVWIRALPPGWSAVAAQEVHAVPGADHR
jgi:GntR family transcriptional repressor for pyruvate dehydrogenase complex